MSQAVITLIIVLVMAIGFVTEVLPLSMISLSGAFLLAFLGIIDKSAVLSAASGSTCVLLGATMIIGGAIFHSGLAEKLSKTIVKLTGTSENGVMVAVMIVGLVFSSVCSGTSVVAMMLPIVIAMCLEAKIPLSKQMLILSFAASIGCNLTLVGAASNVSTAGMMEEMGIEFLSFFELGKVGLPLCIVFFIYFVTIGKKTLRKPRPVNEEYLRDVVAKADSEQVFNPVKAAITAIILIITFAAMAMDNKEYPMYFVAAAGCVVLILVKCITPKDAIRSIDWATIFIVTGMSAVTKAMTASGAGDIIAGAVGKILGANPNKLMVLLMVLIVTIFLTNIMMNTSTVLVVTPLFIPIALAIGMNPVAVGVAICVGASAPFLTPVGSPTNTLVVKPGNLQFMDFFIPGLGLTVMTIAVSMICIPMFWPL